MSERQSSWVKSKKNPGPGIHLAQETADLLYIYEKNIQELFIESNYKEIKNNIFLF